MNDALLVCISERLYVARDVVPIWLEPNVELENVWEYVERPEAVTPAADGLVWGRVVDHRSAEPTPEQVIDFAATRWCAKHPGRLAMARFEVEGWVANGLDERRRRAILSRTRRRAALRRARR